MRQEPVKGKKRISKAELRRQKMEKMRRKQLDIAYKFPFCRRCKEPLDPKWAKKLKKRGELPLCEKCLPVMMKMYKKTIELWAKFNKQ